MDKYKISAEEFERVRYKRLANSPGASSAYGESRLKGDALKERMDEPFILFMEKLNALISLIGGSESGDSILKHIPTGINPSHTLYDLLGDICSEAAEFASYLSVGDKSLLERLLLIDGAIKLLNEHKSSRENPHGVTAAQVGLGKVNNTSDEEKPLSLAAREALELARSGAHEELATAIAKCLKNEGVQVLDGSLSISGDIFVGGEAKAKQLESLLIEDACIVANAGGVPLAELSGYVIRVTESEAYAIVYDPFDECVKIGLGVYDGDAKVFTFNEGEAQALATRGDIKGGNIPVWNDEKKRFEDSGVSARAVSDLPSLESVAGALRGSASGTAVALKDVSPISHGLGVRVSSKNLIPYPFNNLYTNLEGTTITDNGDGTITLSGKPTRNVSFALMRNVMIPKGTYYYSNIPIEVTTTNMYSFFQTSKGVQTRDRTIVELKEDDVCSVIIVITTAWDGSPVTIKPQLEKGTSVTAHTPYIADTEAVKVRAQGKNLFDGVWEQGIINGNNGTNETVEEYIRSKNYIPVVYGEKYVFSNSVDNTVNAMVYEYTEDFTYNLTTNINIAPNNAYTPSKPTTKYIRFRFNTKALALDSKAQVEIGESVTEHEPYIEPIEYERGEVIKSIYPSTTLTTDTAGALIEVEYNRDINKAFAELQQAIISLGGNV